MIEILCNVNFHRRERYFELALNTGTSRSSESDLTHIPCGVYFRASASGRLVQGNSWRLVRVRTVVPYCFFLVAQTVRLITLIT